MSLRFSVSICAIILLGILGSCHQKVANSDIRGATGVCFIHISAIGNDGNFNSTHQLVLVDGSGKLSDDINRIRLFTEDKSSFKNPDLIPNVWMHAWLTDERFDSTNGPDCSKLTKVELERDYGS